MSGLETVAGITYIIHSNAGISRTFFGWVLSRRVEEEAQWKLVEAWIFGARYKITPYQNDVMRRLVDIIQSNPVDLLAVRGAYRDLTHRRPRTFQAKEVLKLLRQAFVVQIAYQASNRAEHRLDKDKMNESKLHTLAEFQEDLTHAVCFGFYDEDPNVPGVQLDKHLVEE
jgi:hypothetical protein